MSPCHVQEMPTHVDVEMDLVNMTSSHESVADRVPIRTHPRVTPRARVGLRRVARPCAGGAGQARQRRAVHLHANRSFSR